MDVLDWLASWFEYQCDGEWEHGHTVSIGALDNPGWFIKIHLDGTECDGQSFDRVEHGIDHDTDWWTCFTEDNVFHGFGGPLHLRTLLEAFRDWAVQCRREQRSD